MEIKNCSVTTKEPPYYTLNCHGLSATTDLFSISIVSSLQECHIWYATADNLSYTCYNQPVIFANLKDEKLASEFLFYFLISLLIIEGITFYSYIGILHFIFYKFPVGRWERSSRRSRDFQCGAPCLCKMMRTITLERLMKPNAFESTCWTARDWSAGSLQAWAPSPGHPCVSQHIGLN